MIIFDYLQRHITWISDTKNDSYFSSSFKYCLIGDKKGYTMFDGCQLMVGGGKYDVELNSNNVII